MFNLLQKRLQTKTKSGPKCSSRCIGNAVECDPGSEPDCEIGLCHARTDNMNSCSSLILKFENNTPQRILRSSCQMKHCSILQELSDVISWGSRCKQNGDGGATTCCSGVDALQWGKKEKKEKRSRSSKRIWSGNNELSGATRSTLFVYSSARLTDSFNTSTVEC